MKKLPPYGRPLFELQQHFLRPQNYINLLIGFDAWKKAPDRLLEFPGRVLVLPPWESAFQYRWPVKQCDILVYDTGGTEEDYLHELIYCLYKEQANGISYVNPDFNLTFYHKE